MDAFALLYYVAAHRVAKDATQMPTSTKAIRKNCFIFLAVLCKNMFNNLAVFMQRYFYRFVIFMKESFADSIVCLIPQMFCYKNYLNSLRLGAASGHHNLAADAVLRVTVAALAGKGAGSLAV